MCSNEVLQLLLFNLWGIELDVPPIFREMEMNISVDVHIPAPFNGIDRLAFLFVYSFIVAHVFHVVPVGNCYTRSIE